MKEANYKPVGPVTMVAVIDARPTRWEVLFMFLLGGALVIVGWMQYSYVAEARLRREGIPQIVVTATIQAEAPGGLGAGRGW